MRYLAERLAHLLSAPFHLTAEQRKASVRFAGGFAVAALLLVLVGAIRLAALNPAPDHPLWEAVANTRVVLARLGLALALVICGVIGALVEYQILENSELGRRTVIWDQADDPGVKACKTRNAGTLQAALLVANILGLLLGVLR